MRKSLSGANSGDFLTKKLSAGSILDELVVAGQKARVMDVVERCCPRIIKSSLADR